MKKVLLVLLTATVMMHLQGTLGSAKNRIRAAYVNSLGLSAINKILATHPDFNAVVVDIKNGAVFLEESDRRKIAELKRQGTYVICRAVVFQDSWYAKRHPEAAIKLQSTQEGGSGELWWSGRKDWHRYWIDETYKPFWNYNIDIARRGIEAGCPEINFDYVRFPSDGNMGRIAYPFWDHLTPKPTKREVMAEFFAALHRELKVPHPEVVLSIDIYAAAFKHGAETGVAQYLEDIIKYFDVVAPMAYPSHYACREFEKFGVKDPNTAPYIVHRETLAGGFKFLGERKVRVRPWIQAFSIANIYGCGPTVRYTRRMLKEQDRAKEEFNIDESMLWNPEYKYDEIYN